MKLIKILFDIVVTIQMLFTFLFILSNFENLDSIDYQIKLTNSINIEFTLNFYAISLAILSIYAIVILASVQLVSTGLNDEGTKNVAKALKYLVFFTILQIGTNYYLVNIDYVEIVTIFFMFVYFLQVIDSFSE